MSDQQGEAQPTPPPIGPPASFGAAMPSLSDLVRTVTAIQRSASIPTSNSDLSVRQKTVEAETAYTHLLGLMDHYELKKSWSRAIMVLIFGMVIYQSVLLGLVGRGVWSFTN